MVDGFEEGKPRAPLHGAQLAHVDARVELHTVRITEEVRKHGGDVKDVDNPVTRNLVVGANPGLPKGDNVGDIRDTRNGEVEGRVAANEVILLGRVDKPLPSSAGCSDVETRVDGVFAYLASEW
eukprot:scaffold312877_cov44-Tisochrysis_lutea.AAC.1